MTESPDIPALTFSPNSKRGNVSACASVESTPPRPASPALGDDNATPVKNTHAAVGTSTSASTPSASTGTTLKLDMSIGAAVLALVHQLVQPLAVHYSHAQVMRLRQRLTELLTASVESTWNESNPHSGSGSRSLIADRVHGLPAILRRAAGPEIDLAVWSKAIASTRRRKAENEDEEAEWEVWCDPGMVVWRWGGWGWDEVEFDPIKRPRESFQIIWQAAPTAAPEVSSPPAVPTPLRQSKAIPIRAPTLVNVPPTPITPTPLSSPLSLTRAQSPSLLPAVDLTTPTKVHARQVSATRDYGGIGLGTAFRPNGGHKGTDSTSSHSSDSSDTNSHTQPLTPASRPGSADLFPEDAKAEAKAVASTDGDDDEPSRSDRETTPETDGPSRRRSTSTPVTTPTVIPYDGGNVTVLGGGTKLGGSRPPSAAPRGDRTRSPSVSLTSRALSNAVGPNSNGGGNSSPGSPRKHRPRRRIMPTYLGHFGQPGIGAPMMGAFGMQSMKTGQPGYSWPPHGQQQHGVGVGLAPPPVSGANLAAQMGMPLAAAGSGTPRMAS